ncbi:MAG: hypothetical protein ACI4LI_07595 [Candidatus Fimenecus sp.]
MEKIKAFFSNYKSDILNVLGVIALIAVVVVGAVLFFGKDEAQPNIVEDTTVAATTATTEAETTTTEPETTTETAVTTTKTPVTTTKAAPKPTEAPTKAPVNNTPNNTPVNKEEGTLPAGLADDVPGSSYDYEQRLVCYNDDAKKMETYNELKAKGIKPTVKVNKNGTISTYYEVGDMLIVICSRCGKPTGNGTHGTCASSFNGNNCPMCGEWIPAGGCHTCKY